MSDFRQTVREYVRASEALLKVDDLSDHEKEAVEAILIRLETVISRTNTKP